MCSSAVRFFYCFMQKSFFFCRIYIFKIKSSKHKRKYLFTDKNNPTAAAEVHIRVQFVFQERLNRS